MASSISFEIREAIVQVCGLAFYFKAPLRSFMLNAGVPQALYDRHAEEAKFKIGRLVLDDLAALGDEGYEIQRRVVTDFCQLRDVPDGSLEGEQREAGRKALLALKRLATEQKIVADTQRKNARRRWQTARPAAARAEKIEAIRKRFSSLFNDEADRQARGYELEGILRELFEAHGIKYRKPYRIGAEQIDGHFKFEGFDYLVEARWRENKPTVADLGAFRYKVEKKIESTRGIFVSITGFLPSVVDDFTRGAATNIILVDGEDLTVILEQRIGLLEALELKLRKAAQEGIIYFALAPYLVSSPPL